MELKEFIKETLTQIVEGISEAKKANKNSMIEIAPEGVYGDRPLKSNRGESSMNTRMVDFEVALKQTEGKANQVGIGVILASIGSKASSSDKNDNETVTRIKFSVPILFK